MGYAWLSNYSLGQGDFVYRIRPNFHHLGEGIRRSVRTRVSPSVSYSFAPEDFMGLAARMCGKVHGSSIVRRAVQRWLLLFFVSIE